MDHGAVLAAAPPAAIHVDQAIFSSLPSPVARGYRIVAASGGLSTDEKRELVQSAPSHGALLEDGPDATALASFTLRSGRQALFLTRHAGIEQSARGGFRVHTHLLLLNPTQLGKFGNSALRVATAAGPVLTQRTTWTTQPPARLEPLPLLPRSGAAEAAPPAAAALRSILAGLLTGARLLVLDAPVAPEALQAVFDALPAGHRARVSFSGGLRFAPTRKFQLVFTSAAPAEIERCEQDHEYTPVHWSRPPNLAAGAASGWVDAAYAAWCGGFWAELRSLSDQLVDEYTPAELGLLADLWRARRAASVADAAGLAQLAATYATAPAGPPAAIRLHGVLRAALAERQRALTPEKEHGARASEPGVADAL